MSEVLDNQALKALSTTTRQDIMKLFADRPHTASEIATKMKKHVTTVTEHIVMLEKAGLVKRRESTNKWVYYTLTDKGQKLFKPHVYSWVVMLTLSVVALISGIANVFMAVPMERAADGAKEALPMATTIAQNAPAAAVPLTMLIGIVLIVVAGVAISYALIIRAKS